MHEVRLEVVEGHPAWVGQWHEFVEANSLHGREGSIADKLERDGRVFLHHVVLPLAGWRERARRVDAWLVRAHHE